MNTFGLPDVKYIWKFLNHVYIYTCYMKMKCYMFFHLISTWPELFSSAQIWHKLMLCFHVHFQSFLMLCNITKHLKTDCCGFGLVLNIVFDWFQLRESSTSAPSRRNKFVRKSVICHSWGRSVRTRSRKISWQWRARSRPPTWMNRG